NSLRGALIYDDLNAIVRNPAVVESDLLCIARTASWFAPNGEFDAYRPVTTASFAANYALHGTAPLGYHVVSTLLHAAVCVVLATVLARVTGDARLAAGGVSVRRPPAARGGGRERRRSRRAAGGAARAAGLVDRLRTARPRGARGSGAGAVRRRAREGERRGDRRGGGGGGLIYRRPIDVRAYLGKCPLRH